MSQNENPCIARGFDGGISYGMTKEYVRTRSWGVWQAFREVVQNALDETQYVTKKWPASYPCNSALLDTIVRDTGRGITVKHLLIGTSEKPEWSRGRFGEGLKLALMTFLDQGIPVEIRAGDRRIVPLFATANVDGVNMEMFYICYKKEPESITGTEVRIANSVLCQRFRKNFVQGLPTNCIKNFIIRKNDEGMIVWWENILDCDDARGKIYVRDIYVRDMPALFGYNLFDVKLSESRDIANEHDIRRGIEVLWSDIIDALNEARERPGTHDPQHVEQWTELLRKLIDGGLKASMNNSNEVETEIYPPTVMGGVVADLFAKMYGKDAVVVTDPQTLELAKYYHMDPTFFCTKPFCSWLQYATETYDRMSKKAGSIAGVVPKDELPSPLKYIIDDLEQIAYQVTKGTAYSTAYFRDNIEYANLKQGVCGQARYEVKSEIALSIPCLIEHCNPNNFDTVEEAATRCVREYISVLLHEIAHVVSRSTDGTTAFEQELTDMLGFTVTKTLENYKEISALVNDIEDKMKKYK